VVGLVEAVGRLYVVTGAKYDVGFEPADLPADVAAKVEAVDEHAVWMFENRQVLDADDGAGGLLLGDAQPCRLLGRVGHAGLAAGEQEITDLDAARGPASDGRGRAVLHVVGVRDDAEHALEGRLGEGRQCHVGHPYRTVPGRGWTGRPPSARARPSAGKDRTKVARGAQQAIPSAGETLLSALPRGMPAGLR